jgi:glutamate-5-semialdehyde dehydrogenase
MRYLRGGSEAINSNRIIVQTMQEVAKTFGLHPGVITYLDAPGHEAVLEMIKLEGLIDLVIPRGGEGLIRTVTENSRIPVLKHYKGVCHVFVDRDADLKMAEEICFNAKVQRPGTATPWRRCCWMKRLPRSFCENAQEICVAGVA